MTDKPYLKNREDLRKTAEPARRSGRWIWILLAIAILGGVLFFLAVAEDTADVQKSEAPPPVQLVSIETVAASPETVEITSFAEIRPRWRAELRAAISGRITRVFNSALAGERVEAGTVLITIEDSRYVAEMAAAKLALQEAKLSLWQAQNANIIARKEFERTKRKPPNDLALKLPQLEIAQSAMESAQARISAVKRQLDDATVVAPFSGFVTERLVSPGQSVNPGDGLVKLVDSATFELTVELGRNDWVLLEKPLTGRIARVVNQTGAEIARAKIRQGGGFLDEKTRQYKIFLEVTDTGSKPILSGDFVRVILPGITVSAALDIPSSALTQEGHIWHLDSDDRLRRVTPKILFRRQGRVIIAAPDNIDTLRVATIPLISFLPGQRVHPKQVEN